MFDVTVADQLLAENMGLSASAALPVWILRSARRSRFVTHLVLAIVISLAALASAAHADEPLRMLFLGDEGHHHPAAMFELAGPALAATSIETEYSADAAALNADKLAGVDCVLIFRDSGDLSPDQEAALLKFVESGRGLVAVHCASHCFRNSTRYTALVGGRFDRHDSGTFRTVVVDRQHPALRGAGSFETWDETYVHNELSADRQVLMVREHEGGYEPYTWVRRQGAGRVYYTALGHDERTWRHPEFHTLLVAAVRWTTGRVKDDAPPIDYEAISDGLPNYLSGEKWGTEGERLLRKAKPLAPADSQRHIHLPEGLRAELFAAEPDVVKPIAMAFDHRGRLWVAESLDYPNTLRDNPERTGRDQIKICADTDGDGRADRCTVFARDLNIPTSLLPVRDGVLVAVAPHIVLLRDTDGDDVADERRIVLTGFGRRDTHAVLSNLHYGFDNWIYGTVGYSGGTVHAGDEKTSFRQGLLRFQDDGSRFEFLTSTSNNTWGLGFSESGDVFASTANNDHFVHLAIANRYFEQVRGWHAAGSAGIHDHNRIFPIAEDFRQMDWHGGFTAAAGCELYTARRLPERYWGRAALVCEPTGHLVHLDWLVPRGSGFVAREGFNIFASTDPWSAPIAAQTGPDGAIWVLDWYNYVVQHNPTPQGFETGAGNAYVTPHRDQSHGRVWRIVPDEVAGDAKSPSRRDLAGANTAALVTALADDNLHWRLAAQRLLVERQAQEAVEPLRQVVAAGEPAQAVVHALCALDGLGALGRDRNAPRDRPVDPLLRGEVGTWLKHGSPAVRRAVLAVLPRDVESVHGILTSQIVRDRDPAVRLAAMLALAEMPQHQGTAVAVAEALSAAENASDPWIPRAATVAAATAGDLFLTAALKTPAEQVTPALRDAYRIVSEHWARGLTNDQPPEPIVALLSGIGGAAPALAESVLDGLSAGWSVKLPAEARERISPTLIELIRGASPQVTLRAVAFARRSDMAAGLDQVTDALCKDLETVVGDESATTVARLAAARQLVALAAPSRAVPAILAPLSPRIDPALARGLLEAAAETGAAEAAAVLLDSLPQMTPTIRSQTVGLVLSRPAWTRLLLDRLEAGQFNPRDLSIDHEQRLTRHADAKIAERARGLLAAAGRGTNPDRQRVLDELRPLADRRGDPAAGRAVFEKNCAKCHRHSGQGGAIGPDLTGVAARKRPDILAEILDPNRSVEGNFQQYTLVLADGRVLAGLLASETRTTLELVDAEAARHVVLREEIEELEGTSRSLMPEGFEKLPAEELVNLLEFLASPGRYLPLNLAPVASVVSTRGMFYSHDADLERLIFDDWQPKTFEGVPFHLVDPQGQRVANVVMLFGPQGTFPPQMPKRVRLPVNVAASAVHLLSGVSGWGYPLGTRGSISMFVRLVYADGQVEAHPLANGEHFADYIREVDVPGSRLAFRLRGQQIRYLAVKPKRPEVIEAIELVKGPDATAPVVMAVTVETTSPQ
ncbi:MAG: ThuA domain-containing protein [Pirellulales bacterium]|nr:ThuA domain-containing protein [Pirellulales bacterium]